MAGDETQQLLDESEKVDAAAKKRKTLGIPELDPDALPSAQVQSYTISGRRKAHHCIDVYYVYPILKKSNIFQPRTALCKRIKKMEELAQKFNVDWALTELQQRFVGIAQVVQYTALL